MMNYDHDMAFLFQKTLWSFVLKVFENKEMQEACLLLEQRYALDVNVFLFGCWAAKESLPALTVDDIAVILQKTIPWRVKVLEPLKRLRESLPKKRNTPAMIRLYQDAVRNEILAEQIEQSLIVQSVAKLDRTSRDETGDEMNVANSALGNIFTYLRYQNITLHKNDLEKVYRIVKFCFEA